MTAPAKPVSAVPVRIPESELRRHRDIYADAVYEWKRYDPMVVKIIDRLLYLESALVGRK